MQNMDICYFCGYYGGWAAPDNIRIGGLSGIYKAHNYH